MRLLIYCSHAICYMLYATCLQPVYGADVYSLLRSAKDQSTSLAAVRKKLACGAATSNSRGRSSRRASPHLSRIESLAAQCCKTLQQRSISDGKSAANQLTPLVTAVCDAHFAGEDAAALCASVAPVFEAATQHNLLRPSRATVTAVNEEWVSRLAVLAYHLLLVQTGYGVQLPEGSSSCLALVGMQQACTMLLAHGTSSRQPERFLEGLIVLQLCGYSTSGMLRRWEQQHNRKAAPTSGDFCIWPHVLQRVVCADAAAKPPFTVPGMLADLLHLHIVLLMYAAVKGHRLNDGQPLQLQQPEAGRDHEPSSSTSGRHTSAKARSAAAEDCTAETSSSAADSKSRAAPTATERKQRRQLQSAFAEPAPPEFSPLLLTLGPDPSQVEVRIHEGLSSSNLQQPIEFGLFASCAIAKGTEITPYGGILRHKRAFECADDKSHSRTIPASDYVLDGKQLAQMFDRPTPGTQQQLQELLAAGLQPLLPCQPRYSAADLLCFTSSPMGFMANTGAPADQNVRIGSRCVRVAEIQYDVPVLIATRNLQQGEEILSPYSTGHAHAAPSPPQPSGSMRIDILPALTADSTADIKDTSAAAQDAAARFAEEQRTDDYCALCGQDGKLLSCDLCVHSFHTACLMILNQKLQQRPELPACLSWLRCNGQDSISELTCAMLLQQCTPRKEPRRLNQKPAAAAEGAADPSSEQVQLTIADDRGDAFTRDCERISGYPEVVAEVELIHPLQCFLPFHEHVGSLLYGQQPRAVCFTLHWADRQSLERLVGLPQLRDYKLRPLIEEVLWPMSLGCLNHNGRSAQMSDREVQAAQKAPQQGAAWKTCPSSQSVLAFLERDAAALLEGRPRPVAPDSMRNVVYAKDVPFRQLKGSSKILLKGKPKGAQCDSEGGFFGADDEQLQAYLEREAAPDSHLLCGSQTAFHAHRARLRKRWTLVTRDVLRQYHPLFLNQSPLHRRSLVNAACVDFDGVTSCYLYLKRGFQFFNLHVEQLLFTFLHYQATGSSEWIVVDAGQMDKLDELAASFFRQLWPATACRLSQPELLLVARTLLFSKVMFPSVSMLHRFRIRFRRHVLTEGRCLMARGDLAHCGFSTANGETISLACNLITEDSLHSTLSFLVQHLAWMERLRGFLHTPAGVDWRVTAEPAAAAPELPLPADLLRKVVFFAPCNFTCSWLRGLLADLLLLLQLLPQTESEQAPATSPLESVCEYPALQALARSGDYEQIRQLVVLCRRALVALHEQHSLMRQLDPVQCQACKDPRNAALTHVCMLCICPSLQCVEVEWTDAGVASSAAGNGAGQEGEIAADAADAAVAAAAELDEEGTDQEEADPVGPVGDVGEEEANILDEDIPAAAAAAASNRNAPPQSQQSSLHLAVSTAAATVAANKDGWRPEEPQPLHCESPSESRKRKAAAAAASPPEDLHGAAEGEPGAEVAHKRAKAAAAAAAAVKEYSSSCTDVVACMLDSTHQWAKAQYSMLRARLKRDGYLFIRGVMGADVVVAARRAFFEQLLHKHCLVGATADDPRVKQPPRNRSAAAALAWDARTGEIGGVPVKAAKQLGCSEAMTALYDTGMKAFATALCSSSDAAQEQLPFVLLPQCTWMRALLRGGSTQAHSDVGYFLRRTDVLCDLYQRHPHSRFSSLDPKIVAAAVAAATRCGAGMCQSEGAASQLYPCVRCERLFHWECQESLPAWLPVEQLPSGSRRIRSASKSIPLSMERWHCDGCLDSPSDLYTSWMALTDLCAQSSRLQLVPGSHALEGYDRMQAADDGDILPAGYDAEAERHKWVTVPADMRAGDLVLFNWKLIHAATVHEEPRLRGSMDTRIFIPGALLSAGTERQEALARMAKSAL